MGRDTSCQKVGLAVVGAEQTTEAAEGSGGGVIARVQGRASVCDQRLGLGSPRSRHQDGTLCGGD